MWLFKSIICSFNFIKQNRMLPLIFESIDSWERNLYNKLKKSQHWDSQIEN